MYPDPQPTSHTLGLPDLNSRFESHPTALGPTWGHLREGEKRCMLWHRSLHILHCTHILSERYSDIHVYGSIRGTVKATKRVKLLIFLPASQPASPKVTLCFLCLFICILVCASAILTCPIITLRTSLPCDVTLVNLTAALCTSTTTSCLAQLQVRDINAQKQRQQRPNDARPTKSGNPKSKQLLVMSTQPQSH